MLNKLKRAALGAHTPHDKATAASKPVPMPLPAQVRILMSQHIGAPAKEDKTMKILKALLAVFTFLAAALTCALLFVQDKHAPRYIQIYTGEHD